MKPTFDMGLGVALAFLMILSSLGFALYYLMKDKSQSNRTAKALTVRIALSIALFASIWLAYGLGWIQPTGVLQ